MNQANALVNKDIRAVLCDFGLSRLMQTDPSGLTTSVSVKGSTRYLSPELLEEGATHSRESDVWAWGCVLLEVGDSRPLSIRFHKLSLQVLTDEVPYSEARIEHQVLLKIAQGAKPAGLRSYGNLNMRIGSLLERTWHSEPDGRPTIQECSAEVQAIRALPPHVPRFLPRFSSKVLAVGPTPRDRWIAAARHIGKAQVEAMRTIARPLKLEYHIPAAQTYYQGQHSQFTDISSLERFTLTQELTDHRGPIRHLEFSPNGRYLVTCSADRTAIIWTVKSKALTYRQTFAHLGGSGAIEQVAWSPDSDVILTKIGCVIKVWPAEVAINPLLCTITVGLLRPSMTRQATFPTPLFALTGWRLSHGYRIV